MAITRAQQVRQMLKDGNFVMQGGVKNYLGKQKTVNNVPVKWQSGPDKPATELAYITKAEKDLLLKKDIHGSLKDGPNTGPEGIMSLDSQGDKTKDRSPSGSRGPQTGPGGPKGKDRDDPPSNFRSSNVMNPENVRAGVNRNVRSLTDLQGGRIGGAGTDDDKSALKDTGTGKYRLVTSGDDLYDYNLTKDFVQGNLDYQDGKKPLGKDLRAAGASPLQIRNARYRANMMDRFIRTKRDRLLAELELAGIEGAEDLTDAQLSELFATGNLGSAVNLNDILADSSQSGIFDKSKIRYTKGGTFDPTSPTYGGPPQPYTGTGNAITDAIFGKFGKAASGPVTTQGLEKLYEQYKNLQDGFTTDLVDGTYQRGDQVDLATMNRDDLMKEFSPNAYAVEQGLLYNPRTDTFTKRNDDGPSQETDPCKGPNPPAYCFVNQPGDGEDDDQDPTGGLGFRFMSRGGSPMDAPTEGGIMDLESGRQMYFLGKLVKKATRAVKKIAKSPLGKAALLGGAMYFGGGGAGGFRGLLEKGLLKKGATDFTLANLSPMKAIGLTSLASSLFAQEDEDDDMLYRGPSIDPGYIRRNPYTFASQIGSGSGIATAFAADGGRIGLKNGNGVADEDAKAALLRKRVEQLMDDGFDFAEAVKEAMKEGYAEGGRTGFFMGSKLPQGLALVRQMLKFFSEGSKTGKTGSEMLKIVNPKQFTKYLEDPNTLFMKGSTKDGIMASDVVKDYASKVKGERAKMIEDLLGSAKNINKADKSTEKFKKEIIEEMMSKGSDKEAAKSSAEILSDIAESAAGGKEIMKNKPKITEEGILQLEQIVKNLQTGGKTARDLNAQGGRIGLKGGTGSKILNFLKPFGGETKGGKQLEGLLYGSEGLGEILRLLSSSGMFAEGGDVEPVAKKTMPLLDIDGKEMDLREEGGFVPIGRMEKADDVPARLSKNEFVFTADAVRNAGEGDVDKGAEVMYNMMKNLESGGEVSEESQGLSGARDMFQTSKRLEEVL